MRVKNPLRDTYNNIRTNAKRRGVYFSLTFNYWVKFCEMTNYVNLRGRGKEDMSVDRIVDELGYVDGNIQMLTVSANVKKQRKRKGWSVSVTKSEDVPF